MEGRSGLGFRRARGDKKPGVAAILRPRGYRFGDLCLVAWWLRRRAVEERTQEKKSTSNRRAASQKKQTCTPKKLEHEPPEGPN